MKNQLKRISCPLCNSKKYDVLFPSTLQKDDYKYESLINNVKNTLDDYTKHTQLVKCQSCNLVYSNPVEDLQLVLQAYGDVIDKEYLSTEKFRKILLKKHLQKISTYSTKGRILDVGSFAGYFLELAKEEGWDVYGIEPSIWATKVAKKRGIKHVGTDILSAKTKMNYYDAITMWDVIEHLPEPHLVIEKLHAMLKKDGILALGTPDIESIFAKVLGKRCPFLIRMHIILYSPKTLEKLLTHHGFRVLNVSYYGRTFPVSYLVDRIHAKNAFLKYSLSLPKKIPIIANSAITINLHDSFRIIAQKI